MSVQKSGKRPGPDAVERVLHPASNSGHGRLRQSHGHLGDNGGQDLPIPDEDFCLRCSLREQVVNEIRIRTQQRAVAVEIGRQSLKNLSSAALMDRVVRAARDTLGMEYAGILLFSPDHSTLRLEAGVGWKPGHIGHTLITPGPESLAGCTLKSGIRSSWTAGRLSSVSPVRRC